jgi:hypothetical protein
LPNNFVYWINPSDKVFDVLRSSVSQSAINDNDYSFDLFGTYTKKIAENHNVVATIGNTIFKTFGNGLYYRI